MKVVGNSNGSKLIFGCGWPGCRKWGKKTEVKETEEEEDKRVT